MTEFLDGKIAVVTGAASGIGLATVETLVGYGAKVVAGDIQDEPGKMLEERFGEDVKYVHCNVLEEDQIKAMLHTAEDHFGGLDILFNNAGVGGPAEEIDELDIADYDNISALLLRSVVIGTKYAIPLMTKRGGGSIVNTSSVSALNAGFAPIAYSTAKAGVMHFSKVAAAQTGKHKIRVNSICPGFIATSIFGSSLGMTKEQSAQIAEMLAQNMGSMQPVGRVGSGKDIAEMVAFLGSDRASFITGGNFTVDGGITVGHPHSWADDASSPIMEALGISPEQAEEMMKAQKAAKA